MRMNARVKSRWSSLATQLVDTKLDGRLHELAESEMVSQGSGNRNKVLASSRVAGVIGSGADLFIGILM